MIIIQTVVSVSVGMVVKLCGGPIWAVVGFALLAWLVVWAGRRG